MIDTLAVAGMTGLPVLTLVSADPTERELWARVTKRAGELTVHLLKIQASYNAEAISKLFRR